jgi:quinone-modifying oxidoreductase subunit QmoA
MKPDPKPILVIGGGIAGMTAAVEAAEVVYPVVLVESESFLGGRVIRSHRYFPKMCPPACGFEINTRRIRQNPNIAVHTLSTVEELTEEAGAFRARIKSKPRYVTGDVSVPPGVPEALTSVIPNAFNMGMDNTKALYMPHPAAFPSLHVLDKDALSEGDAAVLTEQLPPGAVDLDMEEREFWLDAGAVIVATGWRGYDATNLDHLGFGQSPDVVTNLMIERFAADSGPTGGRIARPSNGELPGSVAFIQCAGSRDENHLPYCSAVCCMASLKQARYFREQDPDVDVTIFYIDVRTVGRLETFYTDLLEDEKVSFVKGKVAGVTEDSGTGQLVLDVEDTVAGEKPSPSFDLVVLATGIVPSTADLPIPMDLAVDDYGFLSGETGVDGVFAAGCATHPCDVSRTTKEATASALKAIQFINRG